MPRGWLSPSTSEAIREILLREGPLSAYEVWKRVRNRFEKYEHPPSYDSVRKILWAARKLGLVREVPPPPGYRYRGGIPPKFLMVVEERIDDPRWRNPPKAYLHPEEFERVRWKREEFPERREEWFREVVEKMIEARKLKSKE